VQWLDTFLLPVDAVQLNRLGGQRRPAAAARPRARRGLNAQRGGRRTPKFVGRGELVAFVGREMIVGRGRDNWKRTLRDDIGGSPDAFERNQALLM
jgi:hypothetical protein